MDGTKIAAGGSAGVGIGAGVVYVADRFGAHLNAEDGAIITAAAVGAFAFLVHNGLRGTLHVIWSGASEPKPEPTPTPAPPAPEA